MLKIWLQKFVATTTHTWHDFYLCFTYVWFETRNALFTLKQNKNYLLRSTLHLPGGLPFELLAKLLFQFAPVSVDKDNVRLSTLRGKWRPRTWTMRIAYVVPYILFILCVLENYTLDHTWCAHNMRYKRITLFAIFMVHLGISWNINWYGSEFDPFF